MAASDSHSDPIVQKLLAQCPPLPPDHHTSADAARPMTLRHLNGILGLAKLLQMSRSATARRRLFDQLATHVRALPFYVYESCTRWTDERTSEHSFSYRLVSQLLATARQESDLSEEIMGLVWKYHAQLVSCILDSSPTHVCVFAIPSLLGAMEAMKSTKYRFCANDVLEARKLGDRLVAPDFGNAVHSATSRAAKIIVARRVVRHYMQRGILFSATLILSHYLIVVQAVLESLVARTLVSAGALTLSQISEKGPRELWRLMAGINFSKDSVLHSEELSESFRRLYAITTVSYGEMRNLAERSLDPHSGHTIPEPSIDEAVSFMCRCLYVGTLLCIQLDDLDDSFLKSILDHVKGKTSHKFPRLTTTCFHVLPVVATFFKHSRRLIMHELITYITCPNTASCDPTIYEFMIPRLDNLIDPATEALVCCMRLESRLGADTSLITGTIHTMMSVLASTPIALSSAGSDAQTLEANRLERIHRNLLLAISRISVTFHDESIILFSRNMIRTSKIGTNRQVRPLLLESILEMATYADHETFMDIIKEALRYIGSSAT
ncbi:phosphatidylinositol-4- kinase, partial [Spiromyces aspiralis]